MGGLAPGGEAQRRPRNSPVS